MAIESGTLPLPDLDPEAKQRPAAARSEALGERIKSVDSLITGLVSLAAALGALSAGLTGDTERAGQIGGLVALCVFAYLGLKAYRAHRARAERGLGSTRPVLRGKFPFQEGDALPERGADLQQLCAMVTSAAFRFGILWGKAGCGKTSLLCAGLIPALRDSKRFRPVYVPQPGSDPLAALAAALATTAEQDSAIVMEDAVRRQLRAAASELTQTTVVIFDHFEQFFSRAQDSGRRAAFLRWLAAGLADPSLRASFLFSVRQDALRRLPDLAPHVADTLLATRLELPELEPEQARRVLCSAVEQGEARLSSSLIQALIEDLQYDGTVNPTVLQLIAARLDERAISSRTAYEQAGGWAGLLSSYVIEESDSTDDPRAARLILRALAGGAAGEPLEARSLTEIVQSIGATEPGRAARAREASSQILKQLAFARLIRHTVDDKYALTHTYLRTAVCRATDEGVPSTLAANRLLCSYGARYRDDRATRIPLKDFLIIWRHASPEARRTKSAGDVMQKSVGRFIRRGALLVVTLGAMLVAAVLSPRQGWGAVTLFAPPDSLSTIPNAYAFDPTSDLVVVANSGPSNGLYEMNFRGDGWPVPLPRAASTSMREVPESNGTAYSALAFSPNGQFMVSGGTNGKMRVWYKDSSSITWSPYVLTDRIVREDDDAGTEAAFPGAVIAIMFNRWGTDFMAADERGHIKVYDYQGYSLKYSTDIGFELFKESLAFNPAGTKVAIKAPAGHQRVFLWEIEAGTTRALRLPDQSPAQVLAVGFDEDDRVLAAVRMGDDFELLALAEDSPAQTLEHLPTSKVNATVLSQDGRTVSVKRNPDYGRIWSRDLRYDTPLRLELLDTPKMVSPDGRLLIVSRVYDSILFERGIWFLDHLPRST